MHTTDACRRGTLSVTPAVLMCGTEASLSPRTGPVCAPFEIADCGKDQRLLPTASFLSSRSRRLMSIGVFEICSMRHERPALHAVTQKARHQHTNNFKGTLYKHSGARCSDPPPKIRSVLIILLYIFFTWCFCTAFAVVCSWSYNLISIIHIYKSENTFKWLVFTFLFEVSSAHLSKSIQE